MREYNENAVIQPPLTAEDANIDVNIAHARLGHAGEVLTHAASENLGWKVKGDYKACEGCLIGKVKQKRVNKLPKKRSENPGEKLYIDISSVNATSSGGAKYWGMMVDDCTRFKWSRFLKEKKELSDAFMPIIQNLLAKGYKIKKVRMDNAGENAEFARNLKEKGIDVQYVAPDTPQQNGVFERAFTMLTARGRSMLAHAKIEGTMKNQLWAECFATATKLDNLMPYKDGAKESRCKRFFKKEAPYAKYLRLLVK